MKIITTIILTLLVSQTFADTMLRSWGSTNKVTIDCLDDGATRNSAHHCLKLGYLISNPSRFNQYTDKRIEETNNKISSLETKIKNSDTRTEEILVQLEHNLEVIVQAKISETSKEEARAALTSTEIKEMIRTIIREELKRGIN